MGLAARQVFEHCSLHEVLDSMQWLISFSWKIMSRPCQDTAGESVGCLRSKALKPASCCRLLQVAYSAASTH